MHEEELVFAAMMTIGCGLFAFLMLRVIMRSIVQMVCHSRDVALKIRLVDAGADADQIERVVRAGRDEGLPQPSGFAKTAPQKPIYATQKH